MFIEMLIADRVADRPVGDIGKEGVGPLYEFVKVFDVRQNERVQEVLLVINMGKGI